MDYPQRTRLKFLPMRGWRMRANIPSWSQQFAEPEIQRIVERLFFIDVVAFAWNCPQYITPRYTAAEVQEFVDPLRQRIAELEAQLKGQA